MNGESTNALVGPLDSDVAIKSRIFTIRGVQVMLDRDLAELYGVEAKALNRQVKRNIERFPEDFMFQLSRSECSRCQIGTLNMGRGSNVKYLPYAFTENGIAMLSGMLRSQTAIEVNIKIMRVFNAMRHALASMAPIFARIEETERRQLEYGSRQITDQRRNEERFDTIFKAMDGGDFPPQKVFFDGRHYEAYSFAKKLVGKAAKSILLVDGYCDDVTLDILSAKRCGVKVTVATVEKTPISETAIAKFNKQNPTLEVRHTGRFHDRFLVIDDKELYHFGASLKDLGRHYCAVSRMDAAFIPSIMQRM
ncbi:MAG: ORF6N domain-containing protein [Kiritimatiellae bacterium]|nr:ORF6N domain-containing protein [Kiritimatiellia bacterium]